MKKNRISACIVTYHDESSIERCLKSIYKIVDEIIVIHDGKCKDNTVKIAKKYTKKVYELRHLGNPEPHRVTSFQKATGNWILVIDTDEFLSKPLQINLRKLVDSNKGDGYFFLWRFWDGTKYFTKKWPHRIGVVKKDKIRFLAILHPEWKIAGKIINVDYQLEHRPNYNNFTFKTFQTKWRKWMSLHAKQILMPFNKIPRFQFEESKFPMHIELIKKYDLGIAPFIFGIVILGALKSAPISEWKNIYKYVVLQGLYYVQLCYEVFKLKYLKNDISTKDLI